MMKFVLRIICYFPLLLPACKAYAIPVSFDQLECLTPARIAEVRRSPSLSIEKAFSACRKELSKKVAPLGLTETQIRLAFVSILAHSMAPYGQSRVTKLAELLKEPVLDCDNYAILTGHFARIFVGKKIHLNFVGFDGGLIGNHAQIFADVDGTRLLLDPTIGLVARISFDETLAGKKLAPDQLKIFRQHIDNNIDLFARKIEEALMNGGYKPSDMLYYFHSIDDYLAFTDEIAPLWKSDVNALVRRFPTPASKALRQNLIHSESK